MPLVVSSHIPLAPLTTFELGGPARHFARLDDEAHLAEAVTFADQQLLPLLVLGGGSNLVVGDAGFPGFVLQMCTRGLVFEDAVDHVRLRVAAGEPWDGVVAAAVARGLAGIECLSGIPGLAGATPIQNVGAYGQEVADTLASVRVFDRAQGRLRELGPDECGFGYRDSAFKRHPGRHIVLEVTFALRPGGSPSVRYAELAAALPERASLSAVRTTVLALRRRKSMVWDAADPNHRSAGSFFTNPVLPTPIAEALVARLVAEGVVADPTNVPRFAAGPGQTKLSAGWLIERAGFTRGTRRGQVGLSSAHALALVHHGGGTTSELLTFARQVRDGVAARFGVTLTPEPVLVGASFEP